MKDTRGTIHFAHVMGFGLSVAKKLAYAGADAEKTQNFKIKDSFAKSWIHCLLVCLSLL